MTIPEETLEYFILYAQQAAGSNCDGKGYRLPLLGAEGGPFEVLTDSTGVQVLYVCEYVCVSVWEREIVCVCECE